MRTRRGSMHITNEGLQEWSKLRRLLSVGDGATFLDTPLQKGRFGMGLRQSKSFLKVFGRGAVVIQSRFEFTAHCVKQIVRIQALPVGNGFDGGDSGSRTMDVRHGDGPVQGN